MTPEDSLGPGSPWQNCDDERDGGSRFPHGGLFFIRTDWLMCQMEELGCSVDCPLATLARLGGFLRSWLHEETPCMAQEAVSGGVLTPLPIPRSWQ